MVIPVYNVSSYIEESIKSICNQKFENYQIILVNDGTEDNSIALAKTILSNSNIDYLIISQENKGLPSARNAGLKKAEGKYVLFMDSDDIVLSDFLISLYTMCEDNQCDAAFTEYEVTKLNNRFGRDNIDKGTELINRDSLLYSNMLRSIKIHLCAMLIKKDILEKKQIVFDESLRFGEEVDFIWRLFPLLNMVGYVKSKKYKYLIRNNSLMTSQKKERVVFLFQIIKKDIDEWFEKNPIDREKYKWIEQKIYFEKIHAFAQYSKYNVFSSLLVESDYKTRLPKLFDFPDSKIRFLSKCLYDFPYLFWAFFRITKL